MNTERSSLQKHLLFWLLPPIFLLTSIWVVSTYFIVLHFANQAYDHELEDTVLTVAGQVQKNHDIYSIELSPAARQMLEFDEFDLVYFSVSGPKGNILIGNHVLPRHFSNPVSNMHFYDITIDGQSLRLGEYAIYSVDGTSEKLLVQVAETTRKRVKMARTALLSMIIPQLAFIVGIAWLVWFGVGRGISPLSRISESLSKRTHEDLSPLDTTGLPTEVHKQVTVINDLMLRLGQIIQARRRFIADATHQLRTPITVLRTQVELASRTQDPKIMASIIHQMDAATARLSRLANQLLSLSRAEAGPDQLLTTEHLDLQEVIQEAVATMVPFAMEKNIDISLSGDSQQIDVCGDRHLLAEMFVNLVDNGIRYTHRDGKVRVSVRSINGYVKISITDTGPGIPVDEREKVLERFYRGETTNIEGTGLGLPIAREIALLHSGRIILNASSTGSGLVVTIEIPLVDKSKCELLRQ